MRGVTPATMRASLSKLTSSAVREPGTLLSAPPSAIFPHSVRPRSRLSLTFPKFRLLAVVPTDNHLTRRDRRGSVTLVVDSWSSVCRLMQTTRDESRLMPLLSRGTRDRSTRILRFRPGHCRNAASIRAGVWRSGLRAARAVPQRTSRPEPGLHRS